MAIAKDPAFIAYLITALLVSMHMLLLDAYAGVVRAKSKTVVNPEDLSTVARSASLVDGDPPDVARVMRAHRNLLANGAPFLILGLIWVLTHAPFGLALALFGTFVAARLVHTAAYLGAKQPWRTASFVVGQLAILGILAETLRNVFA